MKLCWFGCGILAVLLALSLLCGMLTQRSTRDAAAALEQALEALDRDETVQAVEAGAQARQHWQRHRRFLCAVLSHDELDGIEQGFIDYALPLIQGQPELTYENGLPRFVRLKKVKA